MLPLYTLLLSSCSLVAARHVYTRPIILPRTVTSLDSAAVAEAQQRDDTATRAFTNAQITTSDGRCLFVDKLSGDFRENLTPIQVAACGSTDGQGWDLITAGKHNNVPGAALVVSSLTNACLNFDPRRAAGNQVLLFSCGGRADGGGDVTNSQLFGLNSTTGPLSLEPENAAGSCVTVKGDVLDIASCDASDANQQFTFGSAAATLASTSSAAGTSSRAVISSAASSSSFVFANSSISVTVTSAVSTPAASVSTSCSRRTRTVVATVTMKKSKGASSTSASVAESLTAGIANGAAVASALFSASVSSSDSVSATSTAASSFVTSSASVASSSSSSLVSASSTAVASSSSTASSTDSTITGKVTAIAVPDTAVPVSRGGNFNPSAAAEANQRDTTATRAFSDVAIRAPNGQCLFVDPTAGDFRENLIPISLVDCAGTPNEKWDVITAGVHNDVPGTALIVSALTNGCISFDSRRAAGDTVNMFPCGGRADGSGETNADQLMPFIGALSFAFAPTGENNSICVLSGETDTRLTSGACPTDGAQLFSVIP